MPIYAYRCSACGHAKEVLQKISDPVLTTCPACGEQTFSKQLTAAGFQLKGSGWYVTDFRGSNNSSAASSSSPSDKPASNTSVTSDPISANSSSTPATDTSSVNGSAT